MAGQGLECEYFTAGKPDFVSRSEAAQSECKVLGLKISFCVAMPVFSIVK
jgi:hypothetical protein